MATFTVPTTGVYTNSRTGGRFKHIAGSVIDLALAVDLGMEGASLPAAGPPFNDAQVTYLQDEFEPEGNFAATDHTHALTNLIANSEFETNITGWSAAGGATLEHNVDDWAWSGTGALKVTTPGNAANEGVVTAALPVVAGHVYAAQAVFATEDTHVVSLRISFDAAGSRILGTAQVSDITQLSIGGVFVVPPGCTTVTFQLRTNNVAAGDFYVDELYLIHLGPIT